MKSKPINASEKEWISQNISATRGMISSLDDAGGDVVTPEALDKVYGVWFASHEKGQEDPNAVINAMGIAFGSYLVDTLAMEWAIVKSQGVMELAVVGQPGDIAVFPANLVAKRYGKGETGFFSHLYSEMKNTVEEIRALPPRVKPWWKLW